MRAEYVAPLGSTSLIFNFLFAKFLVNTPVTWNDIYGTIIVIIGVIGIVAFGSINSGFASETDAHHLTELWTRGNWLAYFFFMSFALILLYIFTAQLDQVLAARSDLTAEPFAGMRSRAGGLVTPPTLGGRVVAFWDNAMMWTREKLELWTASHDDKRIAWTLGIGWACCGGGLAGATLVFAKAAVKLISGAMSHENTGNQFGHASVIFTFIFLAVTAVCQIICLNKGLAVYDSTLVVPVFYGVYTGLGFLNSLIFNDEVDAYQSWALFLIFCAMIILVSGVVLLTYKKPEPKGSTPQSGTPLSGRGHRSATKGTFVSSGRDEEEALHEGGDIENDDATMWQLGEASDDEDEAGGVPSRSPRSPRMQPASPRVQRKVSGISLKPAAGQSQINLPRGRVRSQGEDEEASMLADQDDADDDEGDDPHRRPSSSSDSDATLARPDTTPYMDDDAFGAWEASPPAKAHG
ncbi:transporter [Ganoderma sinense ZZ0214-1]|uniref:Transporter n=1 Tax=Ganoderma sinense ZZ0214-1 TaxID=1077348 RepID=A0A2G8SJS3_9APHY|nr:transporter [Ganoderma sinense ZZ0214-1]